MDFHGASSCMLAGTTPVSRRVIAGDNAGDAGDPAGRPCSASMAGLRCNSWRLGGAGSGTASLSVEITAIFRPISTTSSTWQSHSLNTPATAASIG
jgi:hypothetical protein